MATGKKITAIILCLALCLTSMFTFTGCADIGTALTINETKIPAGVYIVNKMTAMSEASALYKEENPNLDTSAGVDYDVITVEGKVFTTWVEDRTLELCKQYVAVEEMFDASELTYTAEQKKTVKNNIAELWAYSEQIYLYYYYGIPYNKYDSFGDYYEKLGVSKESYQKIVMNTEKREMLFNSIYGKDGSSAVAQADIETYYKENYARIGYFLVDLLDGSSKTITDEAAIAERKALAESYATKLANGDDFATVKAEYDAFVKKLKEDATPATTGTASKAEAENDAEQTTPEVTTTSDGTTAATTTTTLDGTTADTTTTEGTPSTGEEEKTEVETLLAKTSTTPSADFVKAAFELENGKSTVFDSETGYYVIVRYDIMERTDWFEDTTSAVLKALKGDEFEATLSTKASAYTVEQNEAAINEYT